MYFCITVKKQYQLLNNHTHVEISPESFFDTQTGVKGSRKIIGHDAVSIKSGLWAFLKLTAAWEQRS